MLPLLITATLILPLAPQDDAKKKADPRVEAAVERLEKAFDGKDPVARMTAIQGAAEVVDAKVIELVADALKDKYPDVKRSAVETLGFMIHPDALDALHGFAKKEKRALQKDPELFEVVIRSIGRHADPKSIKFLSTDAFSYPDGKVVRARMFSLANIRTTESVEKIFDLMKKSSRKKVQGQMKNVRVALMVLTGVDEGVSQDDWMTWWNNNKKKLVVKDEMGRLPKEVQMRWDQYWGNPRMYDRNKKRKDRGDDPEDDDQ